ncbi:G-protein-signaling modulator 2-like [Boleophthalmus pectinirostris]|uniref:G-protein-signaling modulator 2-like n=1 Tax=Boleophthalmus pectinirostris TaxID=150288 RepID=UPI00242AEBED|nr:G-protein-signaling modulator 2-like [Boleophthalmus pectinirostris]
MSTPAESPKDTGQFDNQMSLLNYQISVTESSPEAQRKCVPNQIQAPSETECSADDKEQVPNEEDKLINMIHYGQRGRMEDQCCRLDPNRSAPCSPHNTRRKPIQNLGLENETFLNVLASSQSRRLDDQRVSLPSLPGLKKDTSSNPDSSYLCYMVSKVQGSRMDDQKMFSATNYNW